MKVKIKSESNHNIEIILERLESITNIGKDNRLSYHTFEFFHLQWMLLSIIEYSSSLSIEIKKKILNQALGQLAINKNYSKNYFLEQLTSHYDKHFKTKEETYYLLAALSIKRIPFRKIKIGDSEIRIHGKQFPKEFRKNRNDFHTKYKFKRENKNYTKVSVKIKSKDFKDAYEKAIEVLEVFRSLLCLFLNSGIEIRFGNHSSKPINKILLAEILTLHYEDGTCPDANYFHFIPDYKDTNALELEESKKEKLKNNIKWLIKQYNKCKPKHQATIQKALNLYVSAYDENNKFICFLRAWTVLEILLNTDKNDLLIKRCNSIYNQDSKPINKQLLESLRQYRNEYVHKGDNGLDPLIACYNVQKFIFNLIVRVNLRHARFFKNINEVNSFLDNNVADLKELENRKSIINKTIKIKEQNTNR